MFHIQIFQATTIGKIIFKFNHMQKVREWFLMYFDSPKFERSARLTNKDIESG